MLQYFTIFSEVKQLTDLQKGGRMDVLCKIEPERGLQNAQKPGNATLEVWLPTLRQLMGGEEGIGRVLNSIPFGIFFTVFILHLPSYSQATYRKTLVLEQYPSLVKYKQLKFVLLFLISIPLPRKEQSPTVNFDTPCTKNIHWGDDCLSLNWSAPGCFRPGVLPTSTAVYKTDFDGYADRPMLLQGYTGALIPPTFILTPKPEATILDKIIWDKSPRPTFNVGFEGGQTILDKIIWDKSPRPTFNVGFEVVYLPFVTLPYFSSRVSLWDRRAVAWEHL
ncbi:hypothetical protein HOLleu_27597 [Holothuria leucospilota]|uniref:Uncharacterized protein n=1 Tax=Holothuria leucospilota TaxID=206669 RepID=A0A9Q1BQ53_HOLLE|nr:hypothetical protein HOLleu_27597 [Holothuria leucospilota]